ncbi:MAG: hypothetical protein LUI87_13930 [Lachnospiraceae bacterium]|nr:hypothetical protein [Lachnospiraceae bacterium]
MLSVKTETLKKAAIIFKNEAANLGRRLLQMQDTISWIRRQEFSEALELRHALEKEYEEIEAQRKDLLQLSEALTRICDKYEKTEEKVVGAQDSLLRLQVKSIFEMDPSLVIRLKPLISQMKALGIDIPDE